MGRSFTSRQLRDVMGEFVTGVTVVTYIGPDGPHGVTVNAFSGLSLDPPLVLVCLSSQARSIGFIAASRVFAVNILSDRQAGLARRFARPGRPAGPDALSGTRYRTLVTGSPILEGTVTFLECALSGTCAAGDHMILLGDVLAIGTNGESSPLLFHRGAYCDLAASWPALTRHQTGSCAE